MRIRWVLSASLLATVACQFPVEIPETEPPVTPVVDAGAPCVQAILPGATPCTPPAPTEPTPPVEPPPAPVPSAEPPPVEPPPAPVPSAEPPPVEPPPAPVPSVEPPGPVEPPPSVPTTPALGQARVVAAGQSSDEITWRDDAGRVRTAAFVDDAYRGGYIRRITYELADGSVREAAGGIDQSTGYQGFGYLVSHYDDGRNSGASSSDSRDAAGHSETVWQGKHHLLRSYRVDLHPRAYQTGAATTVHATVHWLVATGRPSLLFSVTYDSSDVAVDTLLADSRAPYGALAWDGTGGRSAVAGVAWGDKYRFTTDSTSTGGFLTIASDWSYDRPNVVPFATSWTDTAEIGLISTRPYALDVSAGDLGVWFDAQGRARGSGKISARCWQKTSATAVGCADTAGDGATAKMPATWSWPFQIVNHGLRNQPTTNKKIAWGTNYGAIGWNQAVSFDRTLNGWSKTSYSTRVLLGARAEAGVESEIAGEEAVRQTTLAATRGSVSLLGPTGVERTDIERYATPGYDPVYGVWRVQADSYGALSLAIDTHGAVLRAPMFVVGAHGTVPRAITLDGVALRADVDYFASTYGGSTWITLAQNLTGLHQLAVR